MKAVLSYESKQMESELLKNKNRKSSISNLIIFCGTDFRISNGVSLLLYVQQALIWISVAENLN